MEIQTLKIELAKRLLESDDVKLIEDVKNLFDKKEQDFWNTLPEHVKRGIEKSQQQAIEGKITPHEVVMQRYAKYL